MVQVLSSHGSSATTRGPNMMTELILDVLMERPVVGSPQRSNVRVSNLEPSHQCRLSHGLFTLCFVSASSNPNTKPGLGCRLGLGRRVGSGSGTGVGLDKEGQSEQYFQ
mmetsp:Transcript_27064/g.77662  ORF Transcript_27064/g.77662 Transcript_27064/m.77662 type:complete len:109 (+) Transcript_27064:64-390(+)